MKQAYLASAVLVAVLWIGSAAVAQTPGTRPGELVLNPIAAASGTGVSNAALINRDEIRVLRVDVAPNGVRNVHSHDDMQYHLFIPTSAGMRFEAAPRSRSTWRRGRLSSSRAGRSTASATPAAPRSRSWRFS